MPQANRGGWKTCSRAINIEVLAGAPYDGSGIAPPSVCASNAKGQLEVTVSRSVRSLSLTMNLLALSPSTRR